MQSVNTTHSPLVCETLFLCRKVPAFQNVNFLCISFRMYFPVFSWVVHSYFQTTSVKMYILFILVDFNEVVFQRLLSEVIIMRRMSYWSTCVPARPKRTPPCPPFPFLPDPFISASTSKWWAATLPDANSPHERESVWGASIGDWQGLLGVTPPPLFLLHQARQSIPQVLVSGDF